MKLRVILFFTPIIFGCQTHKNENLTQKVKIEQLTALTAGMRYLKEICGMEKLPSEEKIVSSAITMMNSDNSLSLQQSSHSRPELTDVRYEKLKNDDMNNDYKCKELSEILNKFIIKIG